MKNEIEEWRTEFRAKQLLVEPEGFLADVGEDGDAVDFNMEVIEEFITTHTNKKLEAVTERISEALPIKQREECDEEDDCPLCGRGLSKKCHTQEISRVINVIREDILQALTNHKD